MFICDKRGLCCKHLPDVEYVRAIRKIDGSCVHLSDDGLCKIYDNRPIFCNVDEGYELVKSYISLAEYYRINYAICRKLKEEVL